MSYSSLKAAAEAAFLHQSQRAVVFEHAGEKYVAKRLAEKPRRLIQTLFMRWLVKRVTGQPLPMQTLALSAAASSMDFEAKRLHSLAIAGVRVPPVVLLTPEYFVLRHCGTVVATLLEGWQAADWRRELQQLARELGEFHAAGQWHGGAQIKNITLQNGITYRIDFEENFGEFLPLSVAQATDLMLFLNSISLAGPIDETEARQLLPQLINIYFATHPDAEVRQVIQRTVPLMRQVAAMTDLFGRWSKKGIRRIRIMVDVLSEVK